jgi:hypothetical protein
MAWQLHKYRDALIVVEQWLEEYDGTLIILVAI